MFRHRIGFEKPRCIFTSDLEATAGEASSAEPVVECSFLYLFPRDLKIGFALLWDQMLRCGIFHQQIGSQISSWHGRQAASVDLAIHPPPFFFPGKEKDVRSHQRHLPFFCEAAFISQSHKNAAPSFCQT